MMMRLRVLGVLAAGVLFLSACGGGSNAGPAASVDGGGGDGDNQPTAFTTCLEEHGVTPPTGDEARTPPSGGPGAGGGFPGISIPGVSDEKLQEAFAACRSEMPEGGPGGGGGFGGAGGQALQAYTSCLRDNGVDVPTTTPGSTPGSPPERPEAGGGPFTQFEDDPNFATANKKCEALLPARDN